MIKEVGFKDDGSGEYLHLPVTLNLQMDQPFQHGVEPFSRATYFSEKLAGENLIDIENAAESPADWNPVNRWPDIVCVSEKFKTLFCGKLKGCWFPTNKPDQFLFVLDNMMDGLSDNTVIINRKEKPYWYESITRESFKDEVEDEYLFRLIQEPSIILCTSKFEDIVRQNDLKGIQFYKDMNFKRPGGERFDGMRFKKYDDEGNCLG